MQTTTYSSAKPEDPLLTMLFIDN